MANDDLTKLAAEVRELRAAISTLFSMLEDKEILDYDHVNLWLTSVRKRWEDDSAFSWLFNREHPTDRQYRRQKGRKP